MRLCNTDKRAIGLVHIKAVRFIALAHPGYFFLRLFVGPGERLQDMQETVHTAAILNRAGFFPAQTGDARRLAFLHRFPFLRLDGEFPAVAEVIFVLDCIARFP